MSHTLKCQIQTSEMLPSSWDQTSSLCFSSLSLTYFHGFFSFNAWKNKYCAQFHQAVNGGRKIPTCLTSVSPVCFSYGSLETSIFCIWVFSSCAGRCHWPGRNICPSHRSPQRGSTDNRESERT